MIQDLSKLTQDQLLIEFMRVCDEYVNYIKQFPTAQWSQGLEEVRDEIVTLTSELRRRRLPTI